MVEAVVSIGSSKAFRPSSLPPRLRRSGRVAGELGRWTERISPSVRMKQADGMDQWTDDDAFWEAVP